MRSILAAILFLFTQAASAAVTGPNPAFTPGALCTSSSADFKNYDYPEHIARCNRNIQLPEKQEVAKNYGDLPASSWPSYEFDHMIPLCAGGANDIQNLWPQPITEAHQKDQLEDQICIAMKAGTLTQAQAMQKVHDWFQQQLPASQESALSLATRGSGVLCETDPTESRAESSMIRVTFDQSMPALISAVRAELLENGKGNEIISSGEAEISGKPSKAASGPLLGLLRYSIRTAQDRFDLYLPPSSGDAGGTFLGFFKASFEDSYPQLSRLVCSRVNH
jgi:hypothetical protein